MRKKQAVRPPASRRRKTHRALETGTLFLSFWNICLDNLPEGAFARRRITPEEAARCIEKAQERKALVCLSADDLLAPYRKRQLDNHKEMCHVLDEHFGIALAVRNFLTKSDALFFAKPLGLVRVDANHSLLVITCMYTLPERRRASSGFPKFRVDPDSVEFHLFQSLNAA